MEHPGGGFCLQKDVLSSEDGESPAEPRKHPQAGKVGHGSEPQFHEWHRSR